ncbi:histone deacetylase 6 [Artemisia annua]|uniref:Histone deacetylase 6 n=1 Tax=Artemisia annua TaxID=35608 RepID=A0A2U1PW47_ARTAN|nr:histone deacetylase 6 [Artemisia annua]
MTLVSMRANSVSLNVPLDEGIDDDNFRSLFRPVLQKVYEVYQPKAIVLRRGANSLAGDELVLSGGAYTIRNVARDPKLSLSIPSSKETLSEQNLTSSTPISLIFPEPEKNSPSYGMTVSSLSALKEKEDKIQFEREHANSEKIMYNSDKRRIKQNVGQNEGIHVSTPTNAQRKADSHHNIARKRHPTDIDQNGGTIYDTSSSYIDLGDPDWRCEHCGASFWYGERLKNYIGCYISSGDTQKIGNPIGNQSVIRRIGIENVNRSFVELTLWDQLAQSFEKDEIDALERPIIIAVSSCTVKRYRDRDTIVGVDCPTLVKSITDPNPRVFPEKLQKIIGKQHIFQLYFSPTCKEKSVEFIHSDILDDPQPGNKIEGQSSAAAIEYTPTPDTPLDNLQPASQTQNQISDIATPTTPSVVTELATTPNAPETMETPVTETPNEEQSSEITPTQQPYIGMQTRSRTDMGSDAGRKSTRRPLFPEEPSDTKKKKA